MASKGQLVIRYAGDTRDLEKANKRGVADVKAFGNKAGTAATAAGKAAGKGFGDKFEPAAKGAGKAGSKEFGTALGAAESGAKGVGKKAGARFGDTFTTGAKAAGKTGASEFGSGIKITISKAEAAGKGAGKGFGDRFKSEAKDAGKDGGEGFSSSLKVGAVAGAAAAGAAVAVALADGMEKEKLGDKVAASLNLSGPQAKKAGDVASKLYAGAWGENMPEVSDAVESVMSSIDGMAKASPKQLHDVTAGVLDLASAFDSDAQTAARDLGILIKTGLAKDATQGLDLITATLQKVPKAMRGDVSDAIEEYAKDFAQLGFTGKQSMELLVSSTAAGKYGIDKMGDSIKEFALRVIDGSTSTDEAFTAIGMDTDAMSDKFLKGGETSKKAFKKTVQGLLDIQNPSKRARAAIKLFGTPLEDLGVQGIPKFLQSLLDAEGGLGKVEGRSKKMGDTLNDNVATKFETAKRAAQKFLTDGLVALYDGFDTGKAKGDGFAGALSEAGATLKPVYETIKDITEIPGFNKFAGKLLAIGTAVFALSGVIKFTGLINLANNIIPNLGDKSKIAAVKMGPLIAAVMLLAAMNAEVNKQYPGEPWYMTMIKAPWRGFQDGLKSTRDLFEGIGNWINDLDILKGIPTDAEVGDAFGSFTKSVGGWFSDMSSKASGSFRNMKDRGLKRMGEFKSEATKKAHEISTNVGGWFADLKVNSNKTWKNIKDGISDKARGASENARRTFGDLKEKGSKKFREFKSNASRIWGDIKSNISDKARDTSESVRSKFGDMKEKASNKLRDLKDSASNIFTRIKDGASDKARKLSENVRSTFGMMKDIAGKKFREFWNGLKTAAKEPVKFVVNTVWNNGLRKMLNTIPGVEIGETKLGFRSGGAVNGPGTGTSDSITARLSKGEHVWTAKEVEAAGGQDKVKALRRAALAGNFRNSDPGIAGFAEGGAIDPAAIARAKKFAASQAGKPYGWGAVGPSAYDCSGFMSAITNVLRGNSPYSRLGSTASFPWGGFEKGPGQFTIGSSPNFSNGIGHMSGNLGGYGVESRGGRGVILGGGAMSPSRFPQVYHMGKGGDFGSGGGGNWWDNLGDIISTMKKLPGQIQAGLSSDSWINPFMKKMVRGVAENVASFINKKIPDIGPIKTNPIKVPTFDRGGTLSPGYNTVYNGLGRPEALRRADDVGSGKSVVYVPREGELGRMLLQILRKEIRAAGGDPVIVLGRRG